MNRPKKHLLKKKNQIQEKNKFEKRLRDFMTRLWKLKCGIARKATMKFKREFQKQT